MFTKTGSRPWYFKGLSPNESVAKMTRIAIPNETSPKDQRVAMTPVNLGKLVRAGAEVQVEAGLGAGCGYSDEQYREAGAGVNGARREMFESADLVLRLNRPSLRRGRAAETGRGACQLSRSVQRAWPGRGAA